MKYLTIQELFKALKPETLADYFVSNFFSTEKIKERYNRIHNISGLSEEEQLSRGTSDLKEKIQNCITEICNLEPRKEAESCIIGIVPYYDELSKETGLEIPTCYDTFVFNEAELKQFDPEQFPVCKTLKDMKQTMLPITTYSFMVEDWKAVIAYKIPHSLIQDYGEIQVAADILYEMTWCGFDYDTSRERAQSIGEENDTLDDASEKIEQEETEEDEIDLSFLNNLNKNEPYVYSEYEKAAMLKNRNATRDFFVKMKEQLNTEQ